jgi:hypothetical protein
MKWCASVGMFRDSRSIFHVRGSNSEQAWTRRNRSSLQLHSWAAGVEYSTRDRCAQIVDLCTFWTCIAHEAARTARVAIHTR